ncbi:MAG: hypothetical protein ACE5LX_08175 [Nitrospinota bacterium]
MLKGKCFSRLSLLLGLLLFFALLGAGPSFARPPSLGQKALDFNLQGFHLRSYIGKAHVVLVFYRGFF